MLRCFVDDLGVSQLPGDTTTNRSTTYTCLHEGIIVLTARAPTLEAPLLAAKRACHDHISIEGALIETGHCRILDPTAGVDLTWPRPGTMCRVKESLVRDKP